MPKTSILGIDIDDIDKGGLERAIVDCVEGGRREVFAYANVNAINIAQGNEEFRRFLDDSHVLYCDGEGVRLGARILGVKPPPRTVLTRWIWDLGALFQERGLSIFLLGGRKETVAAAASRWCERYPKLRLVGYHHGYFEKSGSENKEVIGSINRHSPNVLFVGFGMPGQELWIQHNLEDLQVNAVIPCGGMIDYLAGDVEVAPKWMSDYGMEWIHRLYQDPTRLWKRYIWGNPKFFFRIFQQRLNGGRDL